MRCGSVEPGKSKITDKWYTHTITNTSTGGQKESSVGIKLRKEPQPTEIDGKKKTHAIWGELTAPEKSLTKKVGGIPL